MGWGKQYYLISLSSGWELELTSSQIPSIDFIGWHFTVLYIMEKLWSLEAETIPLEDLYQSPAFANVLSSLSY